MAPGSSSTAAPPHPTKTSSAHTYTHPRPPASCGPSGPATPCPTRGSPRTRGGCWTRPPPWSPPRSRPPPPRPRRCSRRSLCGCVGERGWVWVDQWPDGWVGGRDGGGRRSRGEGRAESGCGAAAADTFIRPAWAPGRARCPIPQTHPTHTVSQPADPTHAHVPMMLSRGIASFSSGVRSDMVRCRLPSPLVLSPPRRLPADARRTATLYQSKCRKRKKSKLLMAPALVRRPLQPPFPFPPSDEPDAPLACLLQGALPHTDLALLALPSLLPSTTGKGNDSIRGPTRPPVPSVVDVWGVCRWGGPCQSQARGRGMLIRKEERACVCACSRPQVFASVRRPYAPRTPVASDTTKAHGHSPPAAPAPQCRPAETNAMPPRAPGWPGRRPTGPAPMAQRGYAVRAALPFSRRRSVGSLLVSTRRRSRATIRWGPSGAAQIEPRRPAQ